MRLRGLLEGKLGEKELAMVPSSFDVIGDIAIMEIPEALRRSSSRIVARVLMDSHSNIKAVYQRTSERQGEYRLEKLVHLAGEKRTETVHKENGCIFHVDVAKAYFSNREVTERQIISSMVKPGENVLVMFSGIAPFAIAIAKKQPLVSSVHAVELNHACQQYAEMNISANRLSGKVFAACGDVREVCPRLGVLFDRIIMPLPRSSHEFLDVAFSVASEKCTIHFYTVTGEDSLFDGPVRLVKEAALRSGMNAKIIGKRKVLTFGPRKWKVCIDFSVSFRSTRRPRAAVSRKS